MFYYSDELLDRLLLDDAPSGDLTTQTLGIGGEAGRMTFRPRGDGRISGLAAALGLMKKLGLAAASDFNDGDEITAGTVMLTAEGRAEALHLGWKAALNIMEWASGVATHTAAMLAAGRSVNPGLHLASTRKSVPGTKPLAQAAVIHGGGLLHRAGLSETILLFAWHRCFTENPHDFAAPVAALRRGAPEKQITVEVENMPEARSVLKAAPEARPHALQLDKFSVPDTAEVVALARKNAPGLKILSAGGVNLKNIAEYAATGIDLVVSSAPYYADPLDIKVVMEHCRRTAEKL
jgi:molybdenum transport protein